MTPELQKKVDAGLKLLQAAEQMAAKVGQPVEIAYSGGKDSDVILELARMSGINYRAIYKNTTIDPPGTTKHAKENGVEVMMPKETFRQIVAKRGMPNRYRRICCALLKEYKVLDYAVVGVRRDESKKRADRYKEPEVCRIYSKTEKARHYMPLLDFTAKDIEAFIEVRGLKVHPLYYDEQGNFHVERRLGCVGCPIAYYKHRINEFKRYPGFVKLYIGAMQQYFDSHPDSKLHGYFNDAYDWFCFSLYCEGLPEFNHKFGNGLFGRTDCKAFLENEFQITLTPITNRTDNPITNRTDNPIDNRVPTPFGTHVK